MDTTVSPPVSPPATRDPRKRAFTKGHLGLGLLVFWCVGVLTFFLGGMGAIWLHSWGPVTLGLLEFYETSMLPAIDNDDVALIVYRTFQDPHPQRGDIVIFNHEDEYWHGRVVGLPGETIQLIRGRVLINGTRLLRERLADYPVLKDEEEDDSETILAPRYKVTLPEGTSHVIIEREGDEASGDSTDPVQVPDGKVFILSDNRDDFYDSRDEDIGTIAIEDIVGSPALIVWSKNRSRIGSVLR